jgi:hypothetical protein
MSELTRRTLIALTWAVAVAGVVCQAVFPAFRHFVGGLAWDLGLFTGWVGCLVWQREERRKKNPPESS